MPSYHRDTAGVVGLGVALLLFGCSGPPEPTSASAPAEPAEIVCDRFEHSRGMRGVGV